MVQVSFVFIGEGSSDSALREPLQDLCIYCGASEAQGVVPNLAALPKHVGHRISDKLRAAISLAPEANLIFIHKDADNNDPVHCYQEIDVAVERLGIAVPYVAVVPIKETEAWVLLDEQAIRNAADNPRGRVVLDLPTAATVENVNKPKERLWELLRIASELSGRKLDNFSKNKSLNGRRKILLQQLDVEGNIQDVSAWKRLCDNLKDAIALLAARNS